MKPFFRELFEYNHLVRRIHMDGRPHPADLQPGDLVLTLGAGDITTLADELAPLLARPDGTGVVDNPEPSGSQSTTLPPRGAQLPADGGDP